jgi:hypothetical protein
MTTQSKKRRQRAALFERQKGRCFYCDCEMVLIDGQHVRHPPKNLATIEHLDDRYSPARGTFQNVRRKVLACLECNHKRGEERTKAMPIYELRVRSGRGCASQ